jgi:hypothetical protein
VLVAELQAELKRVSEGAAMASLPPEAGRPRPPQAQAQQAPAQAPSAAATASAASKQRRGEKAEPEAEAEGKKDREEPSSRLSLWANIRDRMFGGSASRVSALREAKLSPF